MDTLCRVLGENGTLTDLNLAGNTVHASAGQLLAKALSTSRTLSKLDLRNNQLAGGAASALQAAQAQSSVKELLL